MLPVKSNCATAHGMVVGAIQCESFARRILDGHGNKVPASPAPIQGNIYTYHTYLALAVPCICMGHLISVSCTAIVDQLAIECRRPSLQIPPKAAV